MTVLNPLDPGDDPATVFMLQVLVYGRWVNWWSEPVPWPVLEAQYGDAEGAVKALREGREAIEEPARVIAWRPKVVYESDGAVPE